jgi:hypothetical protein
MMITAQKMIIVMYAKKTSSEMLRMNYFIDSSLNIPELRISRVYYLSINRRQFSTVWVFQIFCSVLLIENSLSNCLLIGQRFLARSRILCRSTRIEFF